MAYQQNSINGASADFSNSFSQFSGSFRKLVTRKWSGDISLSHAQSVAVVAEDQKAATLSVVETKAFVRYAITKRSSLGIGASLLKIPFFKVNEMNELTQTQLSLQSFAGEVMHRIPLTRSTILTLQGSYHFPFSADQIKSVKGPGKLGAQMSILYQYDTGFWFGVEGGYSLNQLQGEGTELKLSETQIGLRILVSP